MKGDFSRVRFNAEKNYTAVLQQQGRVSLDADANEQCAINNHLRETETVDIVGRYGGPADDEGFAITVQGNSLEIGRGRYYVNGILCENPQPLPYTRQTFLSNPSPTDAELLASLAQGSIPVIQAYLEVWQRLVTALDDSCLREPALGQADTTARLQTVWRVVAGPPPKSAAEASAVSAVAQPTSRTQPYTVGTRVLTTRAMVISHREPSYSGFRTPAERGTIISPSQVSEDCCAAMRRPVRVMGPLGKLSAFTGEGGGDCSCQPTPAAGYLGLENQLYRVEIQQGGNETQATFKWSRENASVVAAITGVSGSQVYVDSLGFDANLGFSPGQWVEISDDSYLFGPNPNQPGDLYQIKSVTPETLSMTMTQTVAPVNPTMNARLRRWDQSGSSAGSNGISLPVASPYPLENGISVQFTAGRYEPGDYWLIPARTATGEIDWPPCDSDGCPFQPPHRIQVFRAPLACIQWDSTQSQPVTHDCRQAFYPLTELTPSAAPPALHISGISWNNDDIMTLDQLVLQPLAGSVAVTKGSAKVTGRRTSFTAKLTPGQWLLFASDEELYQISAIASDTELTLAANYKGNTEDSTTALVSGLTVALDRPAPSSQFLTAANFIVSLEVAIPIPITTGNEMLKVITAMPEPIRTTITPLFRTTVAGGAAGVSPRIAVTGSDAGVLTLAFTRERLVSVIRFEILLDGHLNSRDSVLAWLPFLSLRREAFTLGLINGLLSLGAAQGIFSRVRVKLAGRTLFTTDSSGNQIFLDGQSFGTKGVPRVDGSPRIDLQFPSGNNDKASDFESWFYLAPILTITSLDVEPKAVSASESGTLPTVTGTVTLNYAPPVDTPVSLSVAPPPNVPAVVTVPSTVIVPKNQTSQSFTVSVNNTGISQAQPFVITASLPPVLGISRTRTASLSVTGIVIIT